MSNLILDEIIAAWHKIAEFSSHVYHTHGFQNIENQAGVVVKDVVFSSVAAGIAAKAAGGDINAVKKAASGAAVSVGVAEGSDLALKIENAVGASLHPVEAAPLPPVPQSAPANAAVGETAGAV